VNAEKKEDREMKSLSNSEKEEDRQSFSLESTALA
jgi:hypothetical protein